MIRTCTFVATILVATTLVSHAQGKAKSYSCNGTLIEPSSLAPSPKTAKLTIDPSQKVSIDLGQGSANSRVLSNNKLQLKFATKDFVAEFFHYTGDLFFLYKSGQLARLTCTPG